jgi:AMP deaminase
VDGSNTEVKYKKRQKLLFENVLCVVLVNVIFVLSSSSPPLIVYRLFNIHMGSKTCKNFAELMRNIFKPMFEATLYPEKHPEIYTFLTHVGGIDCVDDESNHDPLLMNPNTSPSEYTKKENPPYSYWLYHIYANLYSLNRLREKKGNDFFLK